MRGWRILVATLVAFVLTSAPAARACTGAGAAPTLANIAKVQRATLCVVNKRRADAGLRRLRQNDALAAAATAHSLDMVALRYFAHDGPAGDTFLTRATLAGYLAGNGSWGLAENIAFGPGKGGSARTIVRGWMHSPIHRANVLSATARDAGVGLAVGLPDGRAGGGTYTLDLGHID